MELTDAKLPETTIDVKALRHLWTEEKDKQHIVSLVDSGGYGILGGY